MSAFRRKQTGRASLAFSIVTVLMAVVTLQNQPIQALIVIIGAGVLGLLFSSLTVQVEGDTLSWWFGRRFWKQEIARAEIAAIKVCQNPWWYGWGIRWIRNGWLYNVSGREAIEITLTSGRRVRIGTDRATELAAALAPALG